MNEFERDPIRVVACDIFGTATDWYTGIVQQSAAIFRELGLTVDTAAFANEWRDQYRPSLQRVRDGTRAWAYLDTLHRESLDELLARHGIADAVDEHSRRRLVHAWHRLPAWSDAANGLARIRDHYTTAALSNGGFALVTTLVKTAELPFDCVLSAELAETYKPDRRVYRTATELLDVSPAEVLLVAAHNWDIDGAADAGLRTAFLERPQEKGPQRTADRASDTASDLTATSFGNLANALGC